MAQIQVIKRRIKSVGNTKQITKAMELVAASKMRRAVDATLRSRAYSTSAKEVLARLAQLHTAQSYPLFVGRAVKNRLILLITSDRGLAGAYNANLLRLFLENIREDKARGITTKAIVIGSKGARFVSRLDGVELMGSYSDWPAEPRTSDVRPITQTAQKLFIDHQIDAVEIIYTHFISTIRQEVIFEPLLPAIIEKSPAGPQVGIKLEEAVFEPSPRAVLEAVVPRLVEAQFYQAVLEAAASEQSMRMMAMKNASENAGDIIDDLTLEYNGARQAGITQELAEITAGAEAIL